VSVKLGEVQEAPNAFLEANAPGCVFLVTSFAQAKEVTRQQAKKGLSKPDKKPVNNKKYL
jgi:hypothetical protein